MKRSGLYSADASFVDTPEGIFTASGVWFRTRAALLDTYAGAVFAREPLARLITQAEVWLRSPLTLTLWLLPLFLLILPPLPAALAALIVYIGWEILGPSFVSRSLARVLRLLDAVMLQALYYVTVLSIMAAQQQFTALWVGLGAFVLLRWGIVGKAVQPLTRRIRRTLYRMPVPDHVLRAFIVRAALKHGVSLPEFDRIEQEIIKNLNRK